MPAQSTSIIYPSIPVSNEHPLTGTIQPLPQFDGRAKLIVAPAITTARDKKVAIKLPKQRISHIQSVQKPKDSAVGGTADL